MYVWFEALINYLTAARFDGDKISCWPPQVQILGRDIDRFHCIYWPAMLLAADLPLPKKMFLHGHWTRDGLKMSKSLDNFVTPDELLEAVGNQPDAARWFFLAHAKFNNTDFNTELLRIQSDVVFGNKIGNLLSRATSKKCNPRLGFFYYSYEFRFGTHLYIQLYIIQGKPRGPILVILTTIDLHFVYFMYAHNADYRGW